MKFSEREHPDTAFHHEGMECRVDYYTYAHIPVKVLLDEKGKWIGSQNLSYKTKEFEPSNHFLMIKRDAEGDAKHVTKEEFYKLCDDYLAYWTPERIEMTRQSNEEFQKNRDYYEKLFEEVNRKAQEQQEVRDGKQS
ncbi:MAG: hypothetical protein OEY94_05515 [Alphaproteobacteria bacterium]|nr:hypothetical protein [Alphaproteobacteria bacterium]